MNRNQRDDKYNSLLDEFIAMMIEKGYAAIKECVETLKENTGEVLTTNALIKRLQRRAELTGVNWDEVPRGVPKRTKTVQAQKPDESYTQFADGSIEAKKIIECSKELMMDQRKLLEYLGFNPNEWEFQYVKHSIWNQTDEKTLFSVNYKVKPITGNQLTYHDYLEVAQGVFEYGIEPLAVPEIVKGNKLDKDKAMLIPQIEAHLGKLSNEVETGVNYDHHIVEKRVRKVFEQAGKLQLQNNCGTCIIVVGGDFFNSESNNATTAGTPQTSTDTRYKNMFKIGLELYTEGLLTLRPLFDKIEVMLCAGNHSRAMEFFLYMALSCYFKDDERINFSTNYRDTQCYTFGKVGMFFNHGDPNQKRLLGSIPAEFYKEYGATYYRYLFVGHLHKLEVINSENGLTLHRVPAICENDAWHYQNRFGIGNIPQHELMVFDKNRGMLSDHFIYFD